jgi:hypothetical protein
MRARVKKMMIGPGRASGPDSSASTR